MIVEFARVGWSFRTSAIAAVLITATIGFIENAEAYTYRVLHTFPSNGFPIGNGVFIDPSGTLYGGEAGGVYSLTPNADGTRWTHKVIYPVSTNGIIEDVAGNLYGTSMSGGAHNGGFVFRLTPNIERTAWTMTTLVSLPDDGSLPRSNVTYAGASSGALYDGVSPLYGTTSGGGFHDLGVAFMLNPDGGSWDYVALYNFCSHGGTDCTDGSQPWGDVLIDAAGNLFGTTVSGGVNFGGVLYELIENPETSTWTETVLHKFCAHQKCLEGMHPQGAPVMDAAGEILGATLEGGKCPRKIVYCGAAYKVVPNGSDSEFSVLYDFCALKHCEDGAAAEPLMIDSAGEVFGMTDLGGSKGAGTIYRLDGRSVQVLHDFCTKKKCADGNTANGKLSMDAAGNLYGVMQNGGRNGRGVVFELSP